MLLAVIYKKSYCLLPPPGNGRVERSKNKHFFCFRNPFLKFSVIFVGY